MSEPAKYLLVSPCRDEAQYMRATLESVRRQTVAPTLWIVVDDGSTDGTRAILDEYERLLPYLRVVRRRDRGRRSVGPGVIQAFYDGYDTIDPRDFDFLCKLDVDLELPADYFERLLRRMRADGRLGTCSGKPYYRERGGQLVAEVCGDEMSVGMTKFYRTACFLEIGGFVAHVMWDGIDCHRCRMLGWSAQSFDDPALRFVHLRPMGSSQRGLWTGRWRHGVGQWFMGTSLAFMTASALARVGRAPLVRGALAMWLGYVTSLLARRPRYGDAQFRAFLRDYQRSALLLGKRRAIERLEEARVERIVPRDAALAEAPQR
ncbi:MAG: glycosyltransferase family 2 protein [Planctomycetota bacterium]|nr:MAG: glycosyltransferase family 2 protein [Planctomycetota bacterium]